MSRRHHSRSSEVAHITAEVRRMSPQDILDTYGVELLADGKVLDTTYDQTFKSITDWATYMVEQESFGDLEDEYDRYDNSDDEDY